MHGKGALNLQGFSGGAKVAAVSLLAMLLGVGLVAASSPPSDAAVPSDFRRHQEQYWVWYAPQDWVAASGKYDLSISSPTGTLWNRFGASGIPCTNTPEAWFKYIRNNYRDTAKAGFGLYSKPLRGARFTKVGKVVQDSQYSWYEIEKWAGKGKNGKVIKGEMVLTLAVVDASSGTCAQTLQSRGAPAKGNAANIRTLRDVQRTITARNLSL